ncbi:hypothetical protein I4F81_001889 [Pyropia yezoensis]|uniref:Uncharacterized protein n=1 Tax=Pyropia yezoensis TaxID=2788 RepID=A0ACC3BN07_PYRYE|nr:hypothetical protein I4F81_001889 [Neopyropia yezoensis]
MLCEYRIVLPLTVAEYQRGMLYMIAKSSLRDSATLRTATTLGANGKTDDKAAAKGAPPPPPRSGVVIVKNEPFTDNPHGLPPGQYTEKTYHLDAQLPAFLAAMLPTGAGVLLETAWNSFPVCVTAYESPFLGAKFSLVIRSVYTEAPPAGVPVDGPATRMPSHPLYNVVGLDADELACRAVVDLDIASTEHVSLVAGEDPTTWTGGGCAAGEPVRGPFPAGGAWRTSSAGGARMVAVKVVALRFARRGLQGRAEAWGHRYGLRNSFIRYSRRVVCWMDEWLGLSMADIRRLEGDTKRQLDVR